MPKSDSGRAVDFQKPLYDAVDILVVKEADNFRIRGPLESEILAGYQLSKNLTCFRDSCQQHEALISLCSHPDGLVFTVITSETIVAYASFQKPDYPWWKERCFPELLELGSIETDPSWRKIGLGKMLLDALFNNPGFTYFEDFIVAAWQFVHGWDLKETEMSPWAYRKLMLNLFGRYSFKTWDTIDPEIKEDPCNILLARVGKNIKTETVEQFINCCLVTEV